MRAYASKNLKNSHCKKNYNKKDQKNIYTSINIYKILYNTLEIDE